MQAVDQAIPGRVASTRTALYPRELLDDERALSNFSNSAYYLKRARLCEIGKLFSVSRQARGGVDVPSPEKHR
ncbi:hypothetical protein PS723_05107 [Pseudomonas fluorescens]|uniref:Uncharacterized protein n=1 Tax=Pseudomonas fluorescens TaxID=294 RepID=A0A5E7F2Q5_PSEFL|nr:hypothetical protein PS723_05107 [Pseudomonas fluorescens]